MNNNLSCYISQFLTGYGEQGLGGPCELAYNFLINRTEQFGIAP